MSRNLLRPDGVIYFESDTSLIAETLPEGFQLEKEKKAGNVYYGLISNKKL